MNAPSSLLDVVQSQPSIQHLAQWLSQSRPLPFKEVSKALKWCWEENHPSLAQVVLRSRHVDWSKTAHYDFICDLVDFCAIAKDPMGPIEGFLDTLNASNEDAREIGALGLLTALKKAPFLIPPTIQSPKMLQYDLSRISEEVLAHLPHAPNVHSSDEEGERKEAFEHLVSTLKAKEFLVVVVLFEHVLSSPWVSSSIKSAMSKNEPLWVDRLLQKPHVWWEEAWEQLLSTDQNFLNNSPRADSPWKALLEKREIMKGMSAFNPSDDAPSSHPPAFRKI